MYKCFDHPTAGVGYETHGRGCLCDRENLHQTYECLLSVTDSIFGLPLVLAPGEESFDSAPGILKTLPPSVVPVPDGVSEAHECVYEF